MNEDNFEIVISSDDRFEKLIAEVWYKNCILAQLDQETSNLRLKIYPTTNNKPYIFEYETFLAVIEKAKKRLVEGD